MEAVYWYNVTPKDDASASTAPANIIYSYTARIRGVDVTLPPEEAGPSSYEVGDSVWVKIPQGRCTTQFGKGTITGVYSPHSVLVDGTPRHRKGCSSSARSRCHLLQQRFLWRQSADAVFTAGGPHSRRKATTATMVNVGQETRPRTTTLPREFRSDEVAVSKDLLRAVRCVIPKSGRSVKGNVPGHSKRARMCLACRVKTWYGCLEHIWRGEISNLREVICTYANCYKISQ